MTRGDTPTAPTAEWRATVATYACLVVALHDAGALDLGRLAVYLAVAEASLRDAGHHDAGERVADIGGRLPIHGRTH